MASTWRTVKHVVRRKQLFDDDELEETKLRRCLTGWDLTALGLGSTLGVGVYVLVGSVALQLAGPSVVLSFLIAAVAALFAGLCYAEFGARVPRAGGAYIYAYVTTGEMAAFWVGWVQIFEYVFGTASVARGLSTYVDWASNNTMGGWFDEAMPIGGSILAPHFDLLAFLVVITFGLLLAAGVRESIMVNNVLVAINMLTIVFIIIAGATAADTANWSIPAEEVPLEHGSVGGFFPYGALGMIEGAAVCFYGFVGFDSISAAGEEVKNPRRNLPLTIITVLAVAFLAYASIATVVTMMVPYYLITSVTEVFSQAGLDWAKWVVTVGALFGISSSMFGALFPLPRLLYSMASDRLFFHLFAHVEWRQSPVLATLAPTVIIAILAGIFDLGQLVMMMCIGTLISYTVVAASVILLRYRSKDVSAKERRKSRIKQIAGFGEKQPSQSTSCLVEAVLMLFLVACIASALVLRYAHNKMVPAIIINILALVLLMVMTLQPKVSPDLPYKTPLVPVIPCLSIFVNVHLMVFMSSDTWIRIAIWILIGIPFYIIFVCCYKRKKNLEDNLKLSHATKNGKVPIQIVVESPTPPDTMIRTSNNGGGRSIQTEDKDDEEVVEMQEKINTCDIMPYETEDIVVQHAAVIENNEEKEAKIIDMLDKVLQAEEDTYGEVTSLKDLKDETETEAENIVHRVSLSDLSDAGSDASLGVQILSKYDVIAQVHREDLPKVEEEQPDKGEADILEANDENNDHELVTAFNFNDSETNSRTDESGYSDTLDRTVLNDSIEDVKDEPYIPTPPPFDENFFASPHFKKSYTVPKRPSKSKTYDFEQHEENKPRESVQSNGSQGDGNLAFGSDRQIHFMSKLNNIFQKQIAPPTDGVEEEQRKRSNSTGNVVDNTEFSLKRDRPALFLDLKKEIMLREVAQNLRPVTIDTKEKPKIHVDDDNHEEEEEEETSMSRTELKSKLENIFANGGAKLLKPRLMKSNPPTPEEVYQPDTSSSESISKLPKMEKNDTLKRQKDRFGAVLNSLNRLSLNKEDVV